MTRNGGRYGKALMRLAALCVVLLTLATLTSGAATARTKILYWTGWGGSELEDLKRIIEEGFNKQQDAIEVETVTIFGAYEKLLAAIAGGQAPDLVSAVWEYQLPSLAARKALRPLDDFVQTSTVVKAEDYWPRLWQSLQYQGKIYGLPITTNAKFLAFNVDMAVAAGLDPGRPPRTTAELDLWARKLTRMDSQGNIEVLGFRPEDLTLWGRIFGGSLYDEANQRVTAADPAIVRALEWMASYNEFLDPLKVDTFNSGLGNYWSPNNPFFAGKKAIDVYGEWIVWFGEKYNPDLRYSLFGFPSPEGQVYTVFGGSMFAIPRNAKHPKEAWTFLEWLSRPEVMK